MKRGIERPYLRYGVPAPQACFEMLKSPRAMRSERCAMLAVMMMDTYPTPTCLWLQLQPNCVRAHGIMVAIISSSQHGRSRSR
jgi:hypothetical protein